VPRARAGSAPCVNLDSSAQSHQHARL
jgi:hypothetical protein